MRHTNHETKETMMSDHKVSKDVRRDNDGTWSRTVWFGRAACPTTVRRYYGYATRADARDGDISEMSPYGQIPLTKETRQ